MLPLSFVLAALVVAGSAAGLLLPYQSWALLASAAGGAVVAAAAARFHGERGAAQALLAATVIAGAALRAVLVAEAVAHPPLVRWFEQATSGTAAGEARVRETPIQVRGRLMRDASPTAFGVQLQMAVSAIDSDGTWQACGGGLSVSIAGAHTGGLAEWRAGRTIVVPVALRRPTEYRNHGLPDQARALAWRGTPLVASAKSGLLVEVERHGRWWDEAAGAIRARVRAAMHRHVARFSDRSAAVGTAILIGDRAKLAPEVERRLQEAGTYHVVAISGGNIALLAGAVLAVLWLVNVRFAPAAAVALLVLIAHAWVIGSGASVMRATAMAGVYLGLRLIDQRTSPVHAVAVTAAGILLVNPLELAGAGFWLTFGATAALLMAASRWQGMTGATWLGSAFGVVSATAAIEMLLMPISAYVFERVTLAGLALNLVAVPAMAVVQGAASICVLADVLTLTRVAEASGHLTHLAALALVDSANLLDWIPWSTWRVPPPAVAVLAAYYAGVAGWWWASRPPIDSLARRRALRGSAVAVCGIWLWIAFAPLTWLPGGRGPLRITAFDVGQGDAFLITAPDRHTVLVDAGGLATGSFDIGDRVLGPALRARGLRRLDYVAITHADVDHLGGMRSLICDFRPRELWAGVPVAGYAPLDELRDRAAATRTPWRWLQRGDRLDLGGTTLVVHHPPVPDWERQRVRNDDSLVIEVRHGAVSIWLTGDVSRAVEQDLLSAADPRRLNVLKAAHHGSLTSSSAPWIDRLHPVAALISAGRGNLYGHPAQAVLRRLSAIGAETFRTDQDGQINLVTDGRSVEVTTFTGRRWRLR